MLRKAGCIGTGNPRGWLLTAVMHQTPAGAGFTGVILRSHHWRPGGSTPPATPGVGGLGCRRFLGEVLAGGATCGSVVRLRGDEPQRLQDELLLGKVGLGRGGWFGRVDDQALPLHVEDPHAVDQARDLLIPLVAVGRFPADVVQVTIGGLDVAAPEVG